MKLTTSLMVIQVYTAIWAVDYAWVLMNTLVKIWIRNFLNICGFYRDSGPGKNKEAKICCAN